MPDARFVRRGVSSGQGKEGAHQMPLQLNPLRLAVVNTTRTCFRVTCLMDPPPKPWPAASASTTADDLMKQTWEQLKAVAGEQVNAGDGNEGADGKKRPPPLPPRPNESTALVPGSYSQGMTGYGSYGGMGSPYGMGLGSFGGYGTGYGGLGGYGGFGGYGGGYGAYGGYGRGSMFGHNPSDESSDFIRIAEESSRQAFQSIESIVHAFGSVSMMLESTYFAVHSSFRAVLGVADHFSKLRGHMTHVISSLAIIKTVNWFVRRLAFILGVTSIDPSDERVWSEAERAGSLSPEALAEALTATQRPGQAAQARDWMRGVGPHYRATGLFDFQTDRPGELAFAAGQEMRIAPKQLQPSVRGWLLASDGKNVGLVPSSYVTIIEMKSGVEQREHSQANP